MKTTCCVKSAGGSVGMPGFRTANLPRVRLQLAIMKREIHDSDEFPECLHRVVPQGTARG